MLTRYLYKLTSLLFLIVSAVLFMAPDYAVTFLAKVPDSTLHPLVKLTFNILAVFSFILASSICTSTTSPSAAKSTGAGLLIGGLLMLIPYRTISSTYLADQRYLLGASLYLSLVGALGLATGVSEAAAGQHQGGGSSKRDRKSS